MLRIPYDNKNRCVHVSRHGEMLKAIHQLFYAYFKKKNRSYTSSGFLGDVNKLTTTMTLAVMNNSITPKYR